MNDQENISVDVENAPEPEATITKGAKYDNKKMWGIGGLILATIIVVGLLFYYVSTPTQESENTDPVVEVQPSELLPIENVGAVVCEEYDSGTAFAAAVDNVDFEYCDCIVDDEESKNHCTSVVRDIKLSESARKQFDESICEEVNDEAIRESCVVTITSGIEYLEENDPEYLISVRASNLNDDSIQEYESLLAEDPEKLEYLLNLSLLYAGKGLGEQEKGFDQTPYVEKALFTIEKAKQLYSDISEVYRVEGYAYEILPDYMKAIDSYEKAIELDSENALAYLGRGHVYNMMGILEDALADFRKAAELDSENNVTAIYSNLCRLTSTRDDLQEEAIKNCNIVITKSEEIFSIVQTHQVLSALYIAREDFGQAEKELVKAETLKPNDANLQVSFANLKIYEGKPEEAQIYAEKAITLTPTKAKAYYVLSNALLLQHKYTEAVEAGLRGVEMVESDVSLLVPEKTALLQNLYFTIANTFEAMGDMENSQKYGTLGEEVSGTPDNE